MSNGQAVSQNGIDMMEPIYHDGRIALMPYLFDNFYRIIWDFLSTPKKVRKGKKGSGVIAVSCCNRREGASTIALNLAVAFSNNSLKNVLLVDGNLRNPVLHSYFGQSREKGLTEVIQGEIDLNDSIREITTDRFYFMSAGRQVQNPILSYESQDFSKILDVLRSSFDLVIFDSSPIISCPETPILGSSTDGMLLVLEAEVTRWEVASAARQDLEKANVNVFGAILNKRQYYIPPVVYRML